MKSQIRTLFLTGLTPFSGLALLAGGAAAPAIAATAPVSAPAAPVASYADLADLADSSRLVLRAEVRRVSRVEAERAPGVRAGWGRFYVEARTRALLTGETPLGEALRYLVDMPLDAKGRPPELKRRQVLLFGRAVPGRPGELQLATPDAQIVWDEKLEAGVRAVLTELAAPDVPARITGVREAIHVPGTLAGEGETQIFLSTADDSAAAITVQHRPGVQPAWGASFSELVGIGAPPARDTLAWYRLACFLPNALPRAANLSETPAARMQAEADYRMVLGELGPCGRLRR